MKRQFLFLLAVAFVAGLFAATSGAQIVLENHYLIYEVPEVYPGPPVDLFDQFGQSFHDILEFDKFANPVHKNGEPILMPDLHQTWWTIQDMQPDERLIGIGNQF
jgi:hypothetical protein